MAWLEDDDAIALAREIVAASPADETEVTIDCVEDRFVRFAGVGPTQSAERERVEVAVRVRVRSAGGGVCEARAACGSLDPDDARAATARAIAIARASDLPLPRAIAIARASDLPLARGSEPTVSGTSPLLPLGGPVVVPRSRADEATRSHGFEDKARWIERALARCREHDLAPAGLARTSALARCIANSAGRAVAGATAHASFSLTASAADASGFAGALNDASGFADEIAGSVLAIDPERVVERAIHKAQRARAPRPIAAGEYTVVLEPPAVSSLFFFLGDQGFGAQAFQEQSSFLCGAIGEQVFSEHLSIVDDAWNPLRPGLPFDGEGTLRQRTLLVDRGRLTGPVTDRASALRLGRANTGHAQPQPSSEGPKPENLVVLPGAATLAELVRGVERGLLVSQLHYTNLIEPRELVLTGTTRHGVFWIEDGTAREAVRDLRFTESLVGALSRASGVGCDLAVSGSLFEGEVVTPAMRIERFRFTSAASA